MESVISSRIRELRIENGYSQKVVASAIGVTLSAYSNYEQGLREPSYTILIKICNFYNTSADYLLGLASNVC